MVVRLDSDGNYKWHTFFGGEDGSVKGVAHSIDGLGNIYITGRSLGPWYGPGGQLPLHSCNDDSEDIFVLKLNSEGEYLWHTIYGSDSGDGDEGYDDCAYSIAIKEEKAVYITGFSLDSWEGPSGEPALNPHTGKDNWEIVVMKLDLKGHYMWHSFYGSPYVESNAYADYGFTITAEPTGELLVSGTSAHHWYGPLEEHPLENHNGFSDLFVLKLSDDAL